MLVACRTAGYPRRPPAALSGRGVAAGSTRAAASTLQVTEGRFLGPATIRAYREASVAGPRNDTLSRASSDPFISRGTRPSRFCRPQKTCHFEGGAARNWPPLQTLAPTEKSSVGCSWPAEPPGTRGVRPQLYRAPEWPRDPRGLPHPPSR